MSAPEGNSEFCFLESLNVIHWESRENKTRFFLREQTLSALLYGNKHILHKLKILFFVQYVLQRNYG